MGIQFDLFPSKRTLNLKAVLPFLIVLIGMAILLIPLSYFFLTRKSQISILDTRPAPQTLSIENLFLGKKGGLTVKIENPKGVCSMHALLIQDDKNLELANVKIEKDKSTTTLELPLQAADLSNTFKEGKANLKIKVSECSFWGRTTKLNQTVTLDFNPPQLSLTSSKHIIEQSGAQIVTYTTSEDSVWSGIKIGPYQFEGFSKPGATSPGKEKFVLFVYSYELPKNTPIQLISKDAAGNESIAHVVPAKFSSKEFRKRSIKISDEFIQNKVGDIIRNTSEVKDTGDLLKNFLLVNRDLRKKNNAFLAELSKKSERQFFWKDAFKPLSKTAIEGSFADYRSYIYQDKKVDEQVHLGFDLASFEKTPVFAAGQGKVLYTGYLGIYGNTVVLDHGFGLTSLYGHLSSIDVKVGDFIKIEQKLGNSGETGLAGGDHLHFSMLIQGVQTNPLEFWDQHWIEDQIYLRLGKDVSGKEPK